jgi:hypothetical protein
MCPCSSPYPKGQKRGDTLLYGAITDHDLYDARCRGLCHREGTLRRVTKFAHHCYSAQARRRLINMVGFNEATKHMKERGRKEGRRRDGERAN